MSAPSWDLLVNEYYEAIFRFCVQMLRSRADAEDATQESFERAYRSLKSLKDPSKARSWLYSIARNVCIDRFRSRTREQPLDGYLGNAACGTFSDLAVDLDRLIEALPQRQREVFVLRHWHGFSTDETATLIGVEPGTVKAHLKRAVDKLKLALEPIAKEERSTAGLPTPSEGQI